MKPKQKPKRPSIPLAIGKGAFKKAPFKYEFNQTMPKEVLRQSVRAIALWKAPQGIKDKERKHMVRVINTIMQNLPEGKGLPFRGLRENHEEQMRACGKAVAQECRKEKINVKRMIQLLGELKNNIRRAGLSRELDIPELSVPKKLENEKEINHVMQRTQSFILFDLPEIIKGMEGK